MLVDDGWRGICGGLCVGRGKYFHMHLEPSLLIFNTNSKKVLERTLWEWLLIVELLKTCSFWHYSPAYLATKTAPPRIPKTQSPTMHPAAFYHQEGQPATAFELSSLHFPGHPQAAHRRGPLQLSHRRSHLVRR